MGGVKDGGCGLAVWEGQGWRVWPCSVGGSRMEGVAMQCGRVRDGGCGHAVWEGQGWRVWPCSVGKTTGIIIATCAMSVNKPLDESVTVEMDSVGNSSSSHSCSHTAEQAVSNHENL